MYNGHNIEESKSNNHMSSKTISSDQTIKSDFK